MEFIVIGAGGVGAVLGTLLEQAGHRVTYWARENQPRESTPFTVQRTAGGSVRSHPLQWTHAGTGAPASSDWVLVCVRTEQLSAALEQVVRHLGADRSVAIATVTFEGALAAARAAGLVGKLLALHVAFGSGFSPGEPRHVVWFPFSPPTLVSAEGQAALVPDAHMLARTLRAAGLPTRSTLDMAGMMRLMFAITCPLLPAWQLCDWDIARLARDRPLRWQTARAMHETARAFAPERGLARRVARGLPLLAYVSVLRLLPLLMNAPTRKLWRDHGPKITEQTRFALNQLLERAERAHAPLEHLALLTRRWSAALALPPSTTALAPPPSAAAREPPHT
jgi:ketopantoate reductase